jgi:para-nitrobenzyl esterase
MTGQHRLRNSFRSAPEGKGMDQLLMTTTETANGRVSGFSKDGIFRFNGIPYAKPPVGTLRWRMPEPPESWAGVRDCSRFGSIAPQIHGAAEGLLGGTAGQKSEDCLYLNIWTPACDSQKRPVMVWIHGGAFVTGAGTVGTYNGKHLALKGDLVVVTINYRLGALGFLNLADATNGILPGTGAEGIADQIEALRWVKTNIASFGGDPKNVTVFGESAGGMSVGALLASPWATSLFHKAIPQSGAADIGKTRENSAKIAHFFLGKLGVGASDAGKLMDAPWETILDAQKEVLAEPRATGSLPFQPTIDGTILPKRAIASVREGSANGIPVMTGTTRDEWKLFTAAQAKLRLMDAAKLRHYTVGLVGEERADDVLAAYPEGSPFERWNAVMTDHSFAIPAVRLAEAQAPYAPTWLYRFDWRSNFLGGVLGSCHALELGFVFGTYNEKLAAAFFGSGTKADALSNAMVEAWTNFARSGAPASAAQWPQYNQDSRDVMLFGAEPPHIESAPNEGRRKVWETIPESSIGP